MASFGLRLAGILALALQLAQSPAEVSSQSQNICEKSQTLFPLTALFVRPSRMELMETGFTTPGWTK